MGEGSYSAGRSRSASDRIRLSRRLISSSQISYPRPLRRQRGDDGFVAGVYEGVSVGDDRLTIALEHHYNKRMLALRHVAQAPSS